MKRRQIVTFPPNYHFPVRLVKEKIKMMQERYKLTHTSIASIAGIERAAWHRLIKSDRPMSLTTLHRLSHYFNQPLSFWFPVVEGEAPPVPATAAENSCGCKELAPHAQVAIKQIAELSAVKKKAFLDLFDSGGQLETILELALILANCDDIKAKKLLNAMRLITILNENVAAQ